MPVPGRSAEEPRKHGVSRCFGAAEHEPRNFPANFMLIAALNPCPCGYRGDSRRSCHCTPPQIERYMSKISGPLLDRIDIHIEVPAVPFRELSGGTPGTSSAEIRAYPLKGEAEILVAADNFHGRTTTIVGFSTEAQYREGFGPFTPGFRVVPFGDADALQAAMSDRTVAFLVEPIQGEAGINVPPTNYLARVRALCDAHGALLVLDEIQTGLESRPPDWGKRLETDWPIRILLPYR